MQFYYQKLGAGFLVLQQLLCDTAPNVADQRLHAQGQLERDMFRKFHVNCTLLEEEHPYQYYYATEVR